jgi:hypothetical protein
MLRRFSIFTLIFVNRLDLPSVRRRVYEKETKMKSREPDSGLLRHSDCDTFGYGTRSTAAVTKELFAFVADAVKQ